MFGCCSSKSAVAVKEANKAATPKAARAAKVAAATPQPGKSPAIPRKTPNVASKQFEGLHTNCRNTTYLDGPERFPVPDDKVSWEVEFDDYDPPEFTAALVKANPDWADKEEDLPNIEFNAGDRKSFTGTYAVDTASNMPSNPMGRTGIKGRGLLGWFGPNFAADPIVTRWKRDENDVIQLDERGRRQLEMVCIRRKDTDMWAIPGGMVERGNSVSSTLLREFGEEALASLDLTPEDREQLLQTIKERFQDGFSVYEGYCDDPRNTDNAWIETTATVFHDDDGSSFEHFGLKAGDDAGKVSWVTISPDMQLYASHMSYVRHAYKILAGEDL